MTKAGIVLAFALVALATGAAGCGDTPSAPAAAGSGGGSGSGTAQPPATGPAVTGSTRPTGGETAPPTSPPRPRCFDDPGSVHDVGYTYDQPYAFELCVAAGVRVRVHLAPPSMGTWEQPRVTGESARLDEVVPLADRGMRFQVTGVRPGTSSVTTTVRMPPGVGAPSRLWTLTVVVR